MVYINQDSDNNIVTRFFDRRIYSDSYFIWKISNDITGASFSFITEDISNSGCSYNQFILTHSDTGSTTGGIDIPLYIEPGHNEYTIYETTEYSLDEQFIVKEIERDILFVELKRGVNTINSQEKNIYY